MEEAKVAPKLRKGTPVRTHGPASPIGNQPSTQESQPHLLLPGMRGDAIPDLAVRPSPKPMVPIIGE